MGSCVRLGHRKDCHMLGWWVCVWVDNCVSDFSWGTGSHCRWRFLAKINIKYRFKRVVHNARLMNDLALASQDNTEESKIPLTGKKVLKIQAA